MPTTYGGQPAPGVDTAVATGRTQFISPLGPGAKYARVDQGVDFSQSSPYLAIGSGTVYAIGTGFAGGTGQAVYYQLDKPIQVGGRVYRQVYVAETSPLVKVGDRVSAGQPVASGGSAELGFARGASPMAPLVGGLGAGTQQTQPGLDFRAVVSQLPILGSPRARAPGPRSGAPVSPGGGVIPGILGRVGNVVITGDPLSPGKSGVYQGGLGQPPPVKWEDFLGKLSSADFWLRILEIVAGGALVLLGLYLLARDLGISAPPTPGPVGMAARAVE